MTLYDALTEYCSSDAYPFHMPGHKRRAAFLCDPARIDLTEIDGFDDLHHPAGILRDAQERAAQLYHSEETHFLVNGSTAGILSAITAVCAPDTCLLMARNSHRSAFHGAALARVKTSWLYPSGFHVGYPGPRSTAGKTNDSGSPAAALQSGPIDPAQVERMLESTEHVSAIFLTSPTYDGVVSDVAQIAKIAHRRLIPLIVDEAHGAHFGMHPVFPKSSVELGADLVIHSLHKTLPALTQTALIHVNGPLVDRGALRRQLDIFQTSSPSYVLMASIDQCISLLSSNGDAMFSAYAKRLARFYRETKLSHLSLIRTDDPSRILIRPPVPVSSPPPYPETGAVLSHQKAASPQPYPEMDAIKLYQTLRKRFHLQPEMVSPLYVLMLSSVCDDEDGFARLTDALLTLDRESEGARPSDLCAIRPFAAEPGITPESCCTITQALEKQAEAVPFSESEGRISSEYLTLYPPGIPLLVPGERIPAGLIRRILSLKQHGYTLTGPEDHDISMIRVIM